ncbi:MAG: hypothetical protein WCF16_08490 [Alphaproteobacteria bacterium]
MEQTTTPDEIAPIASGWTAGDFYYVSLGVHKSRRYHAKLRDFYRGCHHFAVAATAITGTSAFVALFSNAPGIAKWLTAGIAIVSTLDLVIAFSERADQHDDLNRRFTELAAKMAEWEPTEGNYRQACAERIRIEKDETTERRLVDLMAQNDETRARGANPDDLVPLNWWQYRFGYFFTFGMRRLEKWNAEREKERRAKVAPTISKDASH